MATSTSGQQMWVRESGRRLGCIIKRHWIIGVLRVELTNWKLR